MIYRFPKQEGRGEAAEHPVRRRMKLLRWMPIPLIPTMKTTNRLPIHKRTFITRAITVIEELFILYFVIVSANTIGMMFATNSRNSGICTDMSPSDYLVLILLLSVIPVLILYILKLILVYFSLYSKFTKFFYVLLFTVNFSIINWTPPKWFTGDPPIFLAIDILFLFLIVMICEYKLSRAKK